MKSNRLMLAMLAGMAASMSTASQAVMSIGFGANTLKAPKTAQPSRTVGSARNGGRRSSNRAHLRMARKVRNVARNRRAHRG
jgi:hypothetical protein